MKFYDIARGGGKTTKCILELAKNPNSLLIVANEQFKYRTVKELQGVNNIEDRVFTAREFIERGRNFEQYDIIIDEVGLVLQNLLHAKIKFGTATSNESQTDSDCEERRLMF